MTDEVETIEREEVVEATKPISERSMPTIAKPRLAWNPALGKEFADLGVSAVTWRTLVEAIWSEAKTPEAVAMALSYCRARNLDPFKRPVHIVPVWHSGLGRMVETVWPGISELRTTAARTGQYAGKDQVVFGPDVTKKIGARDMIFPEWASLTVYRLVGGMRCAFEGDKVFWEEAYAPRGGKDKDQSPNAMWSKRTRGQISKCAEAHALRQTFPEEVGNMYAAEEMEGQTIGHNGGPPMEAEGGDFRLTKTAEDEHVQDADFTPVDKLVERNAAKTGAAKKKAAERKTAAEPKPDDRPAASQEAARAEVETATGKPAADSEDETDEDLVARIEAATKAEKGMAKGTAIKEAKGALSRIAQTGEPPLAKRAKALVDKYED